jgi:hypothetical protein
MSRIAVFVTTTDRHALPDGRVVERVQVSLRDKSSYTFKCACLPEEKHDHGAAIDRIAAGLANRLEVLPGVAALVGRQISVGNTTATVTDSNIKILGPASFPLYVSWAYENGHSEEKTWAADDPLKAPHPDAVLAYVTAAVGLADSRARAAQEAVAFASDPDPLAPPPVIEEPPAPEPPQPEPPPDTAPVEEPPLVDQPVVDPVRTPTA